MNQYCANRKNFLIPAIPSVFSKFDDVQRSMVQLQKCISDISQSFQILTGTTSYPGIGIVKSTGAAWDTSLNDPLVVGHGGTGKTTFALNGVLYGNAANAIGVTAIGAEGQLLRVGATPFVPAWTTLTMPTTIAAASMFVADSANVLKALTGVAGDLIYTNATPAWTKLAKGTANQILGMKADASLPEWQSHGTDKQVLYNDGVVISGDADFTFDKATNALSVPIVYGGAASGGNLILGSTVHSTKGFIELGATSRFYEPTQVLMLGAWFTPTSFTPSWNPTLYCSNEWGQQAVCGYSFTSKLANLGSVANNSMYTVGGAFVVENDYSGASTGVCAYAIYGEASAKNAQFTTTMELDPVNLSGADCTNPNPNAIGGVGAGSLITGIWMWPGGSGASPGPRDVSAGIVFLAGSDGGVDITGKYKKGIVFGVDSISTISGHKEAINLGENQEIAWYSSGGTVGRLKSDGTSLDWDGNIKLGDLKPLYMNSKNALSAIGTTLLIGADFAHAYIYIEGAGKLLSVDANGFVKAS